MEVSERSRTTADNIGDIGDNDFIPENMASYCMNVPAVL
jgi:hypothetical protein